MVIFDTCTQDPILGTSMTREATPPFFPNPRDGTLYALSMNGDSLEVSYIVMAHDRHACARISFVCCLEVSHEYSRNGTVFATTEQ